MNDTPSFESRVGITYSALLGDLHAAVLLTGLQGEVVRERIHRNDQDPRDHNVTFLHWVSEGLHGSVFVPDHHMIHVRVLSGLGLSHALS